MEYSGNDESLSFAYYFYRTGKLEEAGKVCTKLLETEPENVEILNLLGVLQFQTGEAEESLNTLRKAISFFVTAAKEAEMPMSNSVMKMSRGRLSSQSTPASGKKRQEPKIITKDNRERRDDYGQVLTSSNHQVNNRTSIKLDSGGHVALELAVDLFDISEKDREFVLRLVDLTREYKQIYGNDPIRTDETG